MISINNVTKKYGDRIILENCSYSFPASGIVCLLGASGGGKTTLFNLLAGFDTDYSGEILVGKTPINNLSDDALCNYRRDNTGFVFQNYHLLPGFTALENVLLKCELSEESPDSCVLKAKALLEKLALSEKENSKVETLSGGQKQRVAIARALVNDPRIIFADEPTGALDRATSTEIMTLLKETAQDRLVIVITHDQKICDFAHEVIHIKDRTIEVERAAAREVTEAVALPMESTVKVSAFTRAKKNFKVHFGRYVAVSLAISIGVLAFLFSLSFGNVTNNSIEDFKTKNTAFNNGYIKGADDGKIRESLLGDERIKNVYYQYKLEGLSLTLNGNTEALAEKFPTARATEGLSYGVMPRLGLGEIALTPSFAKKFDTDIKSLLGKKLLLKMDEKEFAVVVSGIYNAGYDDFLVSSDIEQKLYENLPKQDNYSISYDVGEFSDIVAVSNSLKLRGLKSVNASDEVYTLQTTFTTLSRLFFVISVLILGIGLFICAILLIKLQHARRHELGLLSALGFSKGQITAMIRVENLMLSVLATVVNLLLLGVSMAVCGIFSFSMIVTPVQILLSVIATFAAILLLSWVASIKLLRTEPAEALR